VGLGPSYLPSKTSRYLSRGGGCDLDHTLASIEARSTVARVGGGAAQWRKTGRLVTLSFWKAALTLGSCFMTRRVVLAYRLATTMTRKLSRAETSWLLR
jgi:hypothetical protein